MQQEDTKEVARQEEKVQLLTKEASKRRRTSEGDPGSAEGSMVELRFTETSLGGFPSEVVAKLREEEERMQQEDTKEVARQEAKNMLEEEQAFQQIKEYFDQTENWLYEEGEDAPQQTYEDILKSFHEKMNVFQMWKTKFMQMKAKEEEKRRFMEQQDMQRRQHPQQGFVNPQYSQNRNTGPRVSRQIPVVYEGEGPYSRHPHQDHMNNRPQPEEGCGRHPSSSDHGYSRPSHADPFFSEPSRSPMFERSARGNSRRSQMPDDPFAGFGKSPFFNDPLFGW